MMNPQNLTVGRMMSESRYSSHKTTLKLTDKEHAMKIGKRLFEYYDKDKSSNINDYEIECMMFDIYNSIGITYRPEKKDIKEFKEILDVDSDGTVTLMDVQSLMTKYLAN